MGWKNWSYWLKGGVIGLVVLVILYIILMAASARWICEYNEYNDSGNVCSNAQVLHTFLLPISSASFIGATIITVLIIFVLAALIGGMYGKLKNNASIKSKRGKA